VLEIGAVSEVKINLTLLWIEMKPGEDTRGSRTPVDHHPDFKVFQGSGAGVDHFFSDPWIGTSKSPPTPPRTPSNSDPVLAHPTLGDPAP